MRARDEHGQVIVAVVILMATFLVLAGLVFDGGEMLAAKRRAEGYADAAARQASSAISEDEFRRTGRVVLDEAAARAAAQDYLAPTNATLADFRMTNDVVEVTVHVVQPMAILNAFGVGDVTATGVGRARLVVGVRRAQP